MISPELHNAIVGSERPGEIRYCYFEINGQSVRVATPDGATIASLRSFFDPYIASHDQADSFYDLQVVVDSDLYQYIKGNLPASPDTSFTTTLQHDLEYELKCFSSESGEITLVADQPLQLFYLVLDGKGVTRIVATEGSRIRTGLLRIIRSVWMLGHDALIVHGCVLEKNGRGIVVSGEKYAGKTTSLFNLCLRKGYDVVANDRLLLAEMNKKLIAKGVPTVVKLRPNTLKPFPELQGLSDKPMFGVSDLARELKVEVKREALITAIAFLSYDPGCREPVFRKLPPNEASDALASHLFSRREYEWVRLLNIGAPLTGKEPKSEILSRVSCFQLRSNENQLNEVATLLDSWCQA